mmetsp:Transcript_25117/g.51608  ORF Transcript_25117/g.51608 Transcript_25117/m.51608 type:complete len:367 (-) Transcript_25117:104-1204(-)
MYQIHKFSDKNVRRSDVIHFVKGEPSHDGGCIIKGMAGPKAQKRRIVKEKEKEIQESVFGPKTEGSNTKKSSTDEKSSNTLAAQMLDNRTAILIVVFACVRLFTRFIFSADPQIISSNNPDQPLLETVPSFFAEDQSARFSKCAIEHPLIRNDVLAGSNFGKTRGLVVKFNMEGEKQFSDNKDLECLHAYFDSQRLSDANAFVMNILICDPTDVHDGGNDSSNDGHGFDDVNDDEVATVGWHFDQTVGIRSTDMYTAHIVNVWYAAVPDDMRGGELEIYPFDVGYPVKTDAAVIRQHAKKVVPEQNTLVRFRGDSFHRVRSFRSRNGSAPRVSLVLEQYKLDSAAYAKTIVYKEILKSTADGVHNI